MNGHSCTRLDIGYLGHLCGSIDFVSDDLEKNERDEAGAWHWADKWLKTNNSWQPLPAGWKPHTINDGLGQNLVQKYIALTDFGEVPEWLNGTVSKTVVGPVSTEGSNPSLSAEESGDNVGLFLFICASHFVSFIFGWIFRGATCDILFCSWNLVVNDHPFLYNNLARSFTRIGE